MKASISVKVFGYMFIFSLIIVGVIGAATKFVLPTYYLDQQLGLLDESKVDIQTAYMNEDYDLVLDIMEEMENELGGELYFYNEQGGQTGYSMGRGKNRPVTQNGQSFTPTGDFSVYQYTNKIGVDIYVIGVLMDEEYLVYEVPIQTLNKATDTMIDFIWLLLGLVLALALVMAWILSRNLSSPIKKLNALAESMKTKTVKPVMVSKGRDEIGQLNKTLNELYEELRGNIYMLNTELNKERNAENLKKRFLAQATHELKTPIAVISGYAEILYDGMYKDEEERDRYLKNIYEESEAVSKLILDVLDYTKMETGNYKLKPQKVRVKPFLVGLFDRYEDFVESHHLRFELDMDLEENFHMSIDQERFEQVYRNLISNAVEHGQSLIRTRVQNTESKLILSVYNDGPSIDEEDIDNVFESFYKKKGKKKGTGLGLAILKEIVLLHQGEYRVENIEDGVEFTVMI